MPSNLTILARGTYIQGEVFSDDLLVVEGGIEGNLKGDRVIIKSSGQVQGDLNCRSLSIETGGILNGDIRVLSDLAALPDPSQPAGGYAVSQPVSKPPPLPETPEASPPEGVTVMEIEDLKAAADAELNSLKEQASQPGSANKKDEAASEPDKSGEESSGKTKRSKGRLFGGSLFKK